MAIKRTVTCFVLGLLPETRLLTHEEVARANEILLPHMFAKADA